MIAATAMQAAGSAIQGFGQVSQHVQASRVARNNAALSREAALDAEERGYREQIRQGREVAAVRSAQIAAFAANGLDTSAGSPRDIAADTSYFGLLDQGLIRENAGREVRGHLIQAANFTEQGRASRRAAGIAAVSTVFQVGSDILGGASQLKGMQLPGAKAAMPSPSSAGYSSWGASYMPKGL
jgi:hypothetical protein